MRTFALALGAILAPQVAAQCQPWQHEQKVGSLARLRSVVRNASLISVRLCYAQFDLVVAALAEFANTAILIDRNLNEIGVRVHLGPSCFAVCKSQFCKRAC